MVDYGRELILDLHRCDVNKFDRKNLRQYFKQICELIDMQRCKLVFWDDAGVADNECQTHPKLKGTSAVQFILASNITIHTLDLLKRVYVNIFSCKTFDADKAAEFTRSFFDGEIMNKQIVTRI